MVPGRDVVTISRDLAERFVLPLGRRWDHVRGVASRADELRPAVEGEGEGEGDVLVAAAWLHDIGYAPVIGNTRFHPLDGARYLLAHGFPYRIVCLVAHHSGARFEAAERGLSDELAEFPLEESAVMDALVTADLTTGPDGSRLSYDQRVNEILERYPPEHVVHRTWVVAREVIASCIARTTARMTRN